MKIQWLLVSLGAAALLAGCASRGHPRPATGSELRTNSVPRLLSYTVAVIETNRVIFVGGEVKQPGRVTWVDGMTLTRAIRMAGGFTDFADRSRVEIRPAGAALQVVSYAAVARGLTNDPLLNPNDQVHVRKRGMISLPPEARHFLRALF